MTIEIFEDKIVFGNGHTISETTDKSGLTVNSNFYLRKIRYKTQAQGEVSGYASGGMVPSDSPYYQNTIDKFPFAVDANSTDIGDLYESRTGAAGQSSSEYGYNSGGTQPSSVPLSTNSIDRFPFSTDTGSSDLADLTQARTSATGQSSSTHGYTSGGTTPPNVGGIDIIDKFPFSISFVTATDVGNLEQIMKEASGQQSTEYGYTSGGRYPALGSPSYVSSKDKFSFSTDGDSSTVGNLYESRTSSFGQSSNFAGYVSGGSNQVLSNPGTRSTIEKFPFAFDSTSTFVGDLTQDRYDAAGQSSTVSGYSSAGVIANTIDKFPFATDADATDVGDLTLARLNPAGQQV